MAKITRIATIDTQFAPGVSSTPYTFSKTIPADCTYVVMLTVCNRSGSSQDISAVTVNGVGATNIVAFPSTTTSIPRVEAWALVSPATGSQTFSFSYGGSTAERAFIILYFKDQNATPLNAATPLTASGNNTSPAIGPITSNADGTVYTVVGWNNDSYTIDGSPIATVDSNVTGTGSRELAVFEDTGSGSVSLAQTLTGSTQWRAVQFVLDGIAGGGGSSIAAISSHYHNQGLR